jgi:GntR family transcriptional regulator / MocR family aminotransferase
MAIQWAGLSPELLIRIDRDGGQPLRSQLEAAIRSAIREGRLAAGERLPSSRELARDLGVSRGLVQECYGQLLSEGYLDSRVGSATRVAAGAGPQPATAVPAAAVPATAVPAATVPASGARPLAARPRLIADFKSGVPDLASFPRGDWAWATQQACRTTASADFDYGDPRGSGVLREVLAGYLRRVRAAAIGPQELVICTGFAQGLALVLRVLARRGIGIVAFEDPGYGTFATSTSVRTAVAAGARAVPVPVDDRGLDVATLAASGARAVVATPAHQSPTGVVLTPERRHALVEWARRTDGFLIEDDYDSEFRYDREPVGMVQGLAPDRVFAIGTVSKALAPAVRIGWVLAPAAFIDDLSEEKLIADRGTCGLNQLALALLLESGRYDRHLRRMRAVYARRRAALVDALASHAPQARLTGLAAGFHGVLHLPGPADEQTVADAALRRSVGLYPMGSYRSSASPAPPQLVLGFGNVSEHAVRAGIEAIADLFH